MTDTVLTTTPLTTTPLNDPDSELPSTQGMTITGRTAPLEFGLVAFDLYRDIHKAIRSELFSVTEEAGRTDPSDRVGRQALFGHVADVMGLLVEHAEHEDGAIGPVLDRELPDLQARIVDDHEALERRIEGLRDQAATAAAAPDGQPRRDLHRLYVELASFTGTYLLHQDLEERVVMPALNCLVSPRRSGPIKRLVWNSWTRLKSGMPVSLPTRNGRIRLSTRPITSTP